MIAFSLISIATSLFLIVYSYALYPAILSLLPVKNKNKYVVKSNYTVAVLIAAYNEEKVIEEKIRSIYNNLPYSIELEIFVGSDNSNDQTETILKRLQSEFPTIHLTVFKGRTGKAKIVNALAANKPHDILLLTDANVMFTENTIKELILPFSDEHVGMSCANIIKTPKSNNTVEKIESHYIQRENRIKLKESNLWKIVIGAEGGCYAIRNNAFKAIPKNFFMDDFFMSMNVIEQGKHVVFQEKALCLEDVPDNLKEEFKRKIRISIGNFQNLFRFWKLLFRFDKISFAFWSHKVLRWLSPFFMLVIIVNLSFISLTNSKYTFLFYLLIIVFVVPFLLPNRSFLKPFNYAKHFLSMNAALLIGFIRFLSGVKSSIWTPTKRN